MPIASCGLRLDDEAVRVAVGLRLGLDLCVPHQLHCGSLVDARGLHSFVCERACMSAVTGNEVQSSFKPGLGCSPALITLQQVVKCFSTRSITVYVPTNKAFDRKDHKVKVSK